MPNEPEALIPLLLDRRVAVPLELDRDDIMLPEELPEEPSAFTNESAWTP